MSAQYIRVSSEAQAKRYGPDSQRQDIEDACERFGLQAPQLCYEDHISAKGEVVRTDFVRMLADAKAGLLKLLIVGRVDRFARNERQAWNYLDELIEAGVVVFFCDEDVCAGLEEGWEDAVTEKISAAAAWSRTISRNVNKAVRQKRRHGKWVSTVPLGWKLTAVGGLDLDEPKLGYLRRMIEIAQTTRKSFTEIAIELNKEGYRTRRGGLFQKHNVQWMLRSPLLYGAWPQNTAGGRSNPLYSVREGMSPEVISKDEWLALQARINERAKTRAGEGRQKHVYPLRDALRCGEIDPATEEICDAPFGAHHDKSTKHKEIYIGYRHKVQGCCVDPATPRRTISERTLMPQIDALIARIRLSDDALAVVQRYLNERQFGALEERRRRRHELEQKRLLVGSSLRLGGYGLNVEEAEHLATADIQKIDAELASIARDPEIKPEHAALVRDLPSVWTRADRDQRHRLVDVLFEKIHVIRPAAAGKQHGRDVVSAVSLRPEYAALFALGILNSEETRVAEPTAQVHQVRAERMPSTAPRSVPNVEGIADIRAWISPDAPEAA